MRVAIMIAVALGLAVVVILFFQIPPTATAAPELRLSSDPFPLAVGRTKLTFTLTDHTGDPVQGASVSVVASKNAMGTLPLRGRGQETAAGRYDLELIWPMIGTWTLEVSATAPNQDEPLVEQYEVFIYPVSPQVSDDTASYRSVREINSLVDDPTREKLIYIPLGTEALIRSGHGDDVIPEYILLEVDGQNTLVIHNDDLADHTIGPFFVRSAEAVRQTFREPAVFQGTCSINNASLVNIVVEE